MSKTRDEALAHFGVKGMRWGVRNDPKPSLNKSNGTVGVDPVTAVIAMYGTAAVLKAGMNTIDSGNARVIAKKGARFVTHKKLTYKMNPELAKKNMSEADIAKKVVPGINPDHPKRGTNMNCRRCTVVYEMRRRGYDVRASKSIMATGQHGVGLKKALNTQTSHMQLGEKTVFKANDITGLKNTDAPSAVFKALKSQPNGSRGEVGVSWLMGGGHSVAYEIINGKPVIFDTQSGKRFKTPKEFANAYKVSAVRADFTRLDNKKLNEAWVERWAINSD